MKASALLVHGIQNVDVDFQQLLLRKKLLTNEELIILQFIGSQLSFIPADQPIC